MEILGLATAAVIAPEPGRERALLVDAVGLPLTSAPDSPYDYWSSEAIGGVRHLGVWPLAEVAQSCFGVDSWPTDRPVPQASFEFLVADVEAAAAELSAAGHQLLHGARTEPWGQVVARLQTPSGVIVGVCTLPPTA